jgi:hypothetical protein
MIPLTFAHGFPWQWFCDLPAGPFLRQWMRGSATQLEIGRCHMQKPFAYSPVSQKNHAWSLSMWELSILALVVAVMLFMISFAFVNPPSASDHAASERAAPSEFSTGMPLP